MPCYNDHLVLSVSNPFPPFSFEPHSASFQQVVQTQGPLCVLAVLCGILHLGQRQLRTSLLRRLPGDLRRIQCSLLVSVSHCLSVSAWSKLATASARIETDSVFSLCQSLSQSLSLFLRLSLSACVGVLCSVSVCMLRASLLRRLPALRRIQCSLSVSLCLSLSISVSLCLPPCLSVSA